MFTRVGDVVNAAVMLLVVGADYAVVDDERAIVVGRQVAPDHEDALKIEKHQVR